MTEFANIVDLFENTLSRPLSKEDLIKNKISLEEIRALAIETRQDYYKREIPQKSDFEIRPFIDPEFNMGIMDYAIKGNISKDIGSYVFDNNVSGKMNTNIKKLLLYSHSIVINDPLDYILDYFYLNQDKNPPDYIKGRIETVNSLLIDYAEISELIKERIVIPMEFLSQDLSLATFPEKTDTELPINTLKNTISKEHVKNYEREVYRVIDRHKTLDGNADLFFPEINHVRVLKEILKFRNAKFLSKEIQSQFDISLLTELKTINPEKITIKEIVNIRKNDEVFDEWRTFLSQALKITSESYDYNNIDLEFKSVIESDLRKASSDLIKKAKNNNWANNLGDSFSGMVIGSIAGALPGILTNDATNAITGAMGGATPDGIKSIKNISKSFTRQKSTSALRSHLIALGADSS